MDQFINGGDAGWADLEQRARVSCMRFRSVAMPVGCTPASADIGFSVDTATGNATLHVQRGIRYAGELVDVRDWLAAGEKHFPTFAGLRAWVQGGLVRRQAVGSAPTTDLAAVREGLQQANRAVHVEESDLFQRLQQHVLGQDRALRVLSGAITRHCARVEPTHPAVVLAVGMTGVGKTRTAEVLASELKSIAGGDAGYQYLRLDMSEYSEPHRVSQLLGAPQGYVGHGNGSQLLDALRANPRTIVLFDEIEKAHPVILRTLMNGMDAGRLSSAAGFSSGHEVDCRKAVFFFSSNIEAGPLLAEVEARASDDPAVESEICRRRLKAAGMAPEIVGRIGHFLVYRPLLAETQAAIMAISIGEVAKEYGLTVQEIAPNVIIELMGRLRTTDLGARPSRYLIDDMLGSELAKAAREYGCITVVVSGPPIRCEVLHVPARAYTRT